MTKPSNILKQVTTSVISNDEIMPGVYLIWLESPDIGPAAQPGQFVMVRCGAARNLLLMAGGIGIAPLYFVAQEAIKKGCSVKLLYGTPSKHHYPANLLPPQVELISVTEDGTIGRKGLVTDFLPDFVNWADQVFACGPIPMYRDMTRRKRELKLEGKPVQISLEVRMACGLGVCYGCTVKTKDGLQQVCKDGPVFDFGDILWDELADI